MFFEKRVYSVQTFDDVGELAEKLTEMTWTLCTAFRVGDVLFVNDSTSENGAQEYAALDETGQFESITFGWVNAERAVQIIVDCLMQPRTYLGREPKHAMTDHEARFGRACSLCA